MLQIDLTKITNTTVADPGLQVRGGGSALKILPKGSISLPQSCGPRLSLSSKNKGGTRAPPLDLPLRHAKQVELHSKAAAFVPQPCCYDLSNDIWPKYG